MKKLLTVAAIGLVGYKLVKKLRNKNEVEENVNEELAIDEIENNEENIKAEDIEIVEDYENNKLYKVLEFLLTPIVKAGVYIWVRHVLFKKKRDYNETLKRCNNKLKYEAYKYYCKNN